MSAQAGPFFTDPPPALSAAAFQKNPLKPDAAAPLIGLLVDVATASVRSDLRATASQRL